MPEQARAWFQKPWTVIGILVGVLGIAWIGYFFWQVGDSINLINHGQDPSVVQEQKQFQASIAKTVANAHVTASDLSHLESGSNPSLGNPSAPIHIVEFLDYECPYCRESAPVIRAFMQTHSQDAYLILRDFPLADIHPDAINDALSAECVFAQMPDQRFWTYYDRLYASQDAQTTDDLRLYVQQLGVNLAQYDDCMAKQTPLPKIQQSVQDGLNAGVAGTPTFFFNGVKIQGSIDAQSLETIYQEVKKQAAHP